MGFEVTTSGRIRALGGIKASGHGHDICERYSFGRDCHEFSSRHVVLTVTL